MWGLMAGIGRMGRVELMMLVMRRDVCEGGGARRKETRDDVNLSILDNTEGQQYNFLVFWRFVVLLWGREVGLNGRLTKQQQEEKVVILRQTVQPAFHKSFCFFNTPPIPLPKKGTQRNKKPNTRRSAPACSRSGPGRRARGSWGSLRARCARRRGGSGES